MKLDVVRWEKTRLPTMMAEPPVIVRKFQVRDVVAFTKAQFYAFR